MELAFICRRVHTELEGTAILSRSRGGTDSSNPLSSRGVSCKPHFRGASVYDRRNSLMIGRPQALPPATGQADCGVGVEAVEPSLLGDAGQR
jgi:hypothetical protein